MKISSKENLVVIVKCYHRGLNVYIVITQSVYISVIDYITKWSTQSNSSFSKFLLLNSIYCKSNEQEDQDGTPGSYSYNLS